MPAEMLIPALVPRMIERNDSLSAWVDPGDVRNFVSIKKAVAKARFPEVDSPPCFSVMICPSSNGKVL
jgi:hypothetical protein